VKEKVNVTVVQMNMGGLKDKKNNIRCIIDNIKKYGKDADLIVFPELAVQGYVCEYNYDFKNRYWDSAETVPGPTTEIIIKAAREENCYVAFGIAERSSVTMLMYNSIVLVAPDGYIGTSRKMHLAMLEKNYFLPGEESSVFTTKLGKVGMMICYDLFFPETSRILTLKGAEIIIHISASMGGGDKGGVGLPEDKKRFFSTAQIVRALENQVHFIYGDGVGNHYMGTQLGTWKPMGLSKIINNFGEILAQAKYGEEDVISAEITNNKLLEGRSIYPLLIDRHPLNYSRICSNNYDKQ